MREIIGENLEAILQHYNIANALTYSGKIGYWQNFEVRQFVDYNYEKLVALTDEEWRAVAPDNAWWRCSDGSILGSPSYEFIIHGIPLVAWRDENRLMDLEKDWEEMSDQERSEYKDVDDYCHSWLRTEYNDILEYFCDELGASTPKNVCALAIDLAKYNNMTVAELFRKCGG